MIAARQMVETAWRYRRILAATTVVELRKRFAGAVLGVFWTVLNPLIFLLIYLFLMTVVFKVQMEGLSSIGVIAFIFTGLVPFLAMMESNTVATVSIKQNIHLVKNVIVPIDIVPVRVAIMSMVGSLIGFVLTFAILIIDGTLSHWAFLFPVILLLQLLFMIGLAWLLSCLGVLLPDVGYIINTLMIALLFISPIGFRADLVPDSLRFVTMLNPLYYVIDSYRSVLLTGFGPHWTVIAIFAAISLLTFALGASFFRRFKGILVDYE